MSKATQAPADAPESPSLEPIDPVEAAQPDAAEADLEPVEAIAARHGHRLELAVAKQLRGWAIGQLVSEPDYLAAVDAALSTPIG